MLLQSFSDPRQPPAARIKTLHALRRVFSSWWREGYLHAPTTAPAAAQPSAAARTDRKRPRQSDAPPSVEALAARAALAAWLRDQFFVLLEVLLSVIGAPDDREEKRRVDSAEDTAVDAAPNTTSLRIAALRTIAHFMAHATSRAQQVSESGQHFSFEVLMWWLRHALSVDATLAGGTGHGADVKSARTVLNALAVFRSEFIDEFDDVRYHTLRAVTLLAKQKVDAAAAVAAAAAAAPAGRGVRATSSSSSDTRHFSDAASVAAFSACPPGVFQRNAVDLLLAVSLPLTEAEWDAAAPAAPDAGDTAAAAGDAAAAAATAPVRPASRSSWVRAEWGSDAALRDVYASLDARVAASVAAKRAAAVAAAAAAADGGAAVAGGGEAPWRDIETEEAAAAAAAAGASASLYNPDDDDDDAAAVGDDDEEDAVGGGDSDDDSSGGGGGIVGLRSSKAASSSLQRYHQQLQRRHSATAAAASAPKYALLSSQKRAFAEAWVEVLRIPAPPADVRRRCLLALPSAVLPYFPGRYPLLLADYLSSCLTSATSAAAPGTADAPPHHQFEAPAAAGGASGVSNDSAAAAAAADASSSPVVDALLALQSLFVLMTRHGLEFPRFYSAVYALLTPSAVAAKHRGRLFKLLDLFLSSTALPAYLVAAFVKRTARLALTSPTPFALFALPLIYNCVKRHPAITPLLHRTGAVVDSAAASAAAAASTTKKNTPVAAARSSTAWPSQSDPFDALTNDPSSSRALDSSLWELMALASHYHSPVANLARALIVRDAAKDEYDIGDPATSAVTYGGLIGTELGRSVSRAGTKMLAEVPFAFVAPAALLSPDGGAAAGGGASVTTAAAVDFFA